MEKGTFRFIELSLLILTNPKCGRISDILDIKSHRQHTTIPFGLLVQNHLSCTIYAKSIDELLYSKHAQ